MGLMRSNVEMVEIPKDSPLGRRGVGTVHVKPLPPKKANRAEEIVRRFAKARQKEILEDVDQETVDKLQQAAIDARTGNQVDGKQAEVPYEDRVNRFEPAYEYLVYAGIKQIGMEATPSPPAGMMDNGESSEDGWIDEHCNVAECRQLAALVLDRSGMVESKETEGNGSDGSMRPSA